MSGKVKMVVFALGVSALLLILSQVGLALAILNGGSDGIRKAHQHSGYMMAVVSLIYVIWSLRIIASAPTRKNS